MGAGHPLGTLTIESAGDSGATVLKQIPDSDRVQQLLNHMVEEDADRRAQQSASYVRDGGPEAGWADDGWAEDGWAEDPHDEYGGRPTSVL